MPAADNATPLTGMEHAEREVIVNAIIKHGGNMTAAAREAGIAKSTLYVKLKRFGIDERLKRFGLDGLTRGQPDTAA